MAVKRSVRIRRLKEAEKELNRVEVKATMKYARVSPRKARVVANKVRKMSIDDAAASLLLMKNKAARLIKKTLDSAIANGVNNFDFNPDSLYIKSIIIDEGPRLKRLKTRGMGRADIQYTRLSHITVVVGDSSRNQTVSETEREVK